MPKSCHRRHAPSQNHRVSPPTCPSRHAPIQSSTPKCQSRVTHDTPPPLSTPPKCRARVTDDTQPVGSPIQQWAMCRSRVAHVSRSPITSQPRVAAVSCVTHSIQCFGAIRAARLDAGMRRISASITRDSGGSERRCYSSSLARCQDAKGFSPQRPIAREGALSEWGRSMALPSRLDAGRGGLKLQMNPRILCTNLGEFVLPARWGAVSQPLFQYHSPWVL